MIPNCRLRMLSAPLLATVIGLPIAAASNRQSDSATPSKSAEADLFRRIAWQSALDRVGISAGLIDGKIGPKTRLATREFQRVRGLEQTGELDDKTSETLGIDINNAVGRYTITQADMDEIGPVPQGWKDKSKLKRLGHASLEDVIAEKFKCTCGLLGTLNPGKDIKRMKPGDKVAVPIVHHPVEAPKAARVEINLTERIIRVIDKEKRLIGLFHCSVAARKEKMPRGTAKVAVISHDPVYRFDPEKWPEVKERVERPLMIPPGPRNPVGRVWIGLSREGYGMHGTPNPELIGKTGSHGCIRLANWDALRLAKMVEVGTPVDFVDHPDEKKTQEKGTSVALARGS